MIVFVSFWRRSVYILSKKAKMKLGSMFSSPSGGDQFISKKGWGNHSPNPIVFVSFWRRSVYIECLSAKV